MIKQLMVLDGVMAACHFRDDGMLVEGYGMPDTEQLAGLAKFAHDYKRMVQGNADQGIAADRGCFRSLQKGRGTLDRGLNFRTGGRERSASQMR